MFSYCSWFVALGLIFLRWSTMSAVWRYLNIRDKDRTVHTSPNHFFGWDLFDNLVHINLFTETVLRHAVALTVSSVSPHVLQLPADGWADIRESCRGLQTGLRQCFRCSSVAERDKRRRTKREDMRAMRRDGDQRARRNIKVRSEPCCFHFSEPESIGMHLISCYVKVIGYSRDTDTDN